MQYEIVSRALAYVSCFSTMSLFMTSMAIAAINVGKVRPSHCPPNACIAGILLTKDARMSGPISRTNVDSPATKVWTAKS